MKDLILFLQIATVTNAILYSNQTNDPTKSEIADFGEDEGYPISHRQDLFVDCSSYSSLLQATAAPQRTNTIDSLATLASLDPAISFPTVPFEQYWCENFDQTTEVGESIGPWLYGINASEKDYCLSLEKSNYSSWALISPTLTTISGYSTTFTTFVRSPSLWSPTLTQPCCGTLCQIVASRVQLYFWPTPAPYPSVTTVVGSDGFVYTSPSVYVVYRNLHATGQCGTLGPSYSSITLSYHQSDLSTNVNIFESDPVAIHYADLFTNCTSPMTVQRSGQGTGSDTSNEAVHCSPLLQMPAGLQSVNPAWSMCVDTMQWDDDGYVVDPPRALIPAGALVPGQTEAANPTTTAAPVSLASQPLPRKTIPPRPPTVTSRPRIDPVNGNGPSMKNDAAGGIPSREGKDPSTAVNLSAGNIAPADKNAAAVNYVPSDNRVSGGVGQLVGNDPHDRKETQTPKSANLDPSEVSLPVDQRLGELSGGKTSTGIDPAGLGAPVDQHLGELSGGETSAGIDPAGLGAPVDQHLGELSSGKTSAGIDPAGPGAPFTTTIGGYVVQAASSANNVLVDGQYLSRGKGAIDISNTPVALQSNGDLIIGTSTYTVRFHSLHGVSASSNGNDVLIASGLNGRVTLPLDPVVSAAPSVQTPKNTTRPTGGFEAFLGGGDRVHVPSHYIAVMAEIILLTLFLPNAF